MATKFRFLLITAVLLWTGASQAFGQCLSVTTTLTHIECYGDNTGEILVNITAGASPNAQPPWDVELYFRDSNNNLTLLGKVDNSSSTSITFKKGNGSLTEAGADDFGIPANSNVDPGSQYQINVSATGGSIICKNRTVFATITEPAQLQTSSVTDPDCNPTIGSGDGSIDITTSGGTSPYTYLWDDGPTAEDRSNIDAGVYILTTTDDNGCTRKDTFDIAVSTAPDAGNDQDVCSAATTLDGNDPSSSEIGTWTLISGSGTVTSPNLRNSGVTGLGFGVNEFEWAITDTAGFCTGNRDTVAITRFTPPTVEAGAANTICVGDIYTLSGSSFGATATEVTWSIISPVTGGSLNNTSATTAPDTVKFTASAAGTYTLRLTTDDPTGPCPAATDDVVITVNPVAVANAGTDIPACQNEAITVSDADVSGSVTTGSWSIATQPAGGDGALEFAGFTDRPDTVSFTASVLGDYELVLTTDDPAGPCTDVSDTVKITVQLAATVFAGADTTICAGTEVAIDDSDIDGSVSAGTWSILSQPGGGDGSLGYTSSTDQPDTVTFTATVVGDYELLLTTADPAGACEAVVDTVVVTIDPGAIVEAGTQPPVCSGEEVTLTGSSFGGSATQVTWSIVGQPGGGDGVLGFSGATTQPDTVTFTATRVGSYTLRLTTDDPVGACLAVRDSVVISYDSAATVFAGADTTICAGTEVAIDDSDIDGSVSAGTWSILSQPGGGDGSLGYTSSTDQPDTVTFTATVAGVYELLLTTAEPTGACGAVADTVQVTVEQAPQAEAGNAQTVCSETKVTLSGSSFGGSASQVTWSIIGQPSGGDGVLGFSGVTTQPDTVTFIAGVAGAYRLRLTTNDPMGSCVAVRDSVTFTVIDGTPDPGTDTTVSVCNSNAAFDLYENLGGSPDPNGQWSDLDGSGAPINGDIINLTSVDSGTYQFEYKLDVAGCGSDSSVLTLDVIRPPNAGLDSAVSACHSETEFSLVGSVAGTPDAGGDWIQASGPEIIIPQDTVDLTGLDGGTYVFRYIITATTPCVNDTSIVTLTLYELPDAGLDSIVDACNTDSTFSLIESLGGNPDEAGTWNQLSGPEAVTAGDTINLSGVATGNYFFRYVAGGPPNLCVRDTAIVEVRVIKAPDAGLDSLVSACNTETAFSLTGSIGGTPDSGGTWGQISGPEAIAAGGAVDLSGVAGGSYFFRYVVEATTPCASDTAIVEVTVVEAANPGIANAETACNTDTDFNLLDALDGTPDNTGTWADLDTSGGIITGHSVDLSGVTPGDYRFEYTVAGSAPCADSSAVVTITVIDGSPDPGTDNSVTACNSDTFFNLFDNLGGTPNPGGDWEDADASGATITGDTIDLTSLDAGTYDFKYKLTVSGCGSDSSTLSITVIEAPNAGLDSAVIACNTETAFSLMSSVGGSPDLGSWGQISGPETIAAGNTVDLSGVAGGSYFFRYVVGGTSPCANDTAVVELTVIEAPDAGLDSTVTACNTESAFSLISSVGGTPDAGGTWGQISGPEAIAAGDTIDLSDVTGGTYSFRYVVTGVPCANDTSIVTVDVIVGPNAGMDSSVVVCQNENSLDLFASLAGTPETGGTWSDANSSGAVITGNNADFSGIAPGTYDFNYIKTGTGICENDTASVSVTIQPPPDPAFTITHASCTGVNNGSIVITPVAGYTYSITGGPPFTATNSFTGLAAGTYTVSVMDGNGCVSIPETATINANSFILPTIEKIDASCLGVENGSVTVTAISGGTAPYEYSRENGALGSFQTSNEFLSLAGESNHSIIVRDSNGCLSSAFSIIINNDTALTADISKTDASSCVGNDGSITIESVSGGSTPYLYSADGGGFQTANTFSGLVQGDYDIVVSDANGCLTVIETVTVGIISNIVPVISSVDASCKGVEDGEISIDNITGGTGPFEYSLDDGDFVAASVFSDLKGGVIHRVIVKDAAGCLSSVYSIFIDNDTSIDNDVLTTDVSSCVGTDGSVQVTNVTGGTLPYEYSVNLGAYQTSDTFTGLAPGEYDIVVRDATGCTSDTTVVTIGTISNIVPVVEKIDASCLGVSDGVITISGVTGGTAPYSYSVDNRATYSTTNTYDTLAGGKNYTVVVKDSKDCISSAITVFIDHSVIEPVIVYQDVSSCLGNNGQIEITGSTGSAPFEYSINGGDFVTTNTFNGLTADQYQIVVRDSEDCISETATVEIDVVGNIVPVIAKTNAECNGISNGTITVSSVTGGNSPYRYSKDGIEFQDSNVFTDLEAGDYSIVVEDSSECLSSVYTVIINNGLTIAMDAIVADESCTGGDGSIEFTNVSGGTVPYTYSIGAGFQTTPLFESLSQDSYDLVVMDANGCVSAEESVTISKPSNCDPGGGTGQCATVRITPESVDANCADADGKIIFHISPFEPANNILGVVISIDGPVQRTQKNDSIFNDLQAGLYNYTVIYGDDQAPGCVTDGSVVINKGGTVGYPLAGNIQSPACYGDSTGSAVIQVLEPVDLTGQALQWSLTPGDPSSWKDFTAGGTISGIPEGLAPDYQQTLSIRKDATDPCYSGVTIVVQPASNPISVTYNTTDATCSADDGAISGINPSGGTPSGSTFTFSIDGVQFQGEDEFTGLAPGNYTLIVQDQIGCEEEFDVTINAPNYIEFKKDSVIHADCTNNGNSGKLVFEFTAAGTYRVGISSNPLVSPATYVTYTTSEIPLVFDSLSRGEYYVFVESTNAQCSLGQGPYEVQGIYAVDFEITPVCSGTDLSILLSDITGDPAKGLTINVYRKFTSIIETSIVLDEFPVTRRHVLDKDDHEFLSVPNEYSFQLTQPGPTGGCPTVTSDLKDYVVPHALFANVARVARSYPEIPTGEMDINEFAGGIQPYAVRIEMDSASSLALPSYETDFTEPAINDDSQFEKEYTNLPPGRYRVQVMDSLGCLVELVGRVPMDLDIFIPNVFTPNNDGANDAFFIRNLPNATSKLVITNRWGKEVFTSDGYTNDWKGEGAADGIYFYQLTLEGRDAITGWVEIMRGQKP